MEYRVLLSLLIYNEDRSNHLRCSKEVTLPFSPTVGTYIRFKDMCPLRVTRAEWLINSGSFVCNVEDDNGVYEFDTDSDIDELVDTYDLFSDVKKYDWKGFSRIYRDDWE